MIAKLLTKNAQNISGPKGGIILLPGETELTPLQEAILNDSAWALSLRDKGLLLIEDAPMEPLDLPTDDSDMIEEEREKDYWAALSGKAKLKIIEKCDDIFKLKLWADCSGNSPRAKEALEKRMEELISEQ